MPTAVSIHHDVLSELGLEGENLGGFDGHWIGSGPTLDVVTPIDGSRIATVRQVTETEYEQVVARAHAAYLKWRTVPAPGAATWSATSATGCASTRRRSGPS